MKSILALLILGLHYISVSGQSYSRGELVYVISESGLNLRSEKSIRSKVVNLLPNGRKLRIIESDSSTISASIKNIKGTWVKVEDSLDLSIGFVLDYYLSRHPPFNFIKKNKIECWENDVLLDLANEIGKLDSFEYSNYLDGEGWYNMKYYKLNNNVKYIEHGFWEEWESELQFSKLNTYQIYYYVNSLLNQCKDKRYKLERNYFEKNKILALNIYGNCCVHRIRIYSDGNNLIMKLQSEPGS